MAHTLSDALLRISQNPIVDAAALAARQEIDALLWRRDVRSHAREVAAASVARGGRDSAAIDGADVAIVDDSPMGRVLDAGWRITTEVPAFVDIWGTAPLQALAGLHAVAAIDMVPAEELGRPRSGASADDPLNIGTPPDAAAATARLTQLAELVTTSRAVPALVVAGICHAELIAVRPFSWGSGLVARASVRLVLAERGVDPSLFSIPELGMLTLGRPAYVSAIRAYLTGSPDGVSDYLVWFMTCIGAGAREVQVPEDPPSGAQ